MSLIDKDQPADPDDPLIVARAAIDQVIAYSPEVARALYGYHSALVAAGFSGEDALYLTESWMLNSVYQANDET